VGPTSGAIAHLGKDNENGAKMAIEELNAAGLTINGQPAKFELLAEDDAADPKQGTAAAQKLVDAKVARCHRSPELGHHHPGFPDLQRRWHSPDFPLRHQPQVHPSGLRWRVPHGG
jgi:hypothetical protein